MSKASASGRELYVAAANLDDLPDGEAKGYRVKGRELVLTRVGDEVFAMRATCPHQLATLAGGLVRSRLTSRRVGDVNVSEEEFQLTCPWHAWSFSLRTGMCTLDPRLRVRRYDVKVEDGSVLIDL
jgi:nitrite reductase/ring-hydroxylating ferredoxin subunit